MIMIMRTRTRPSGEKKAGGCVSESSKHGEITSRRGVAIRVYTYMKGVVATALYLL
jgi:hypothetical protein